MREVSTALPPIWRGAAPLVLASRSESRRALLSAAGFDVESVAPEVDERALEDRHLAQGGSLENVASELAQAKAHAVSAVRPDAYCIGAGPDAHVRRRDPPQVQRFRRSGANARRALRQDASIDLRILCGPRRASACRPQRSRRRSNGEHSIPVRFRAISNAPGRPCWRPLACIRARALEFICSSALKEITPLFSDCRC